MKYMKYIKIYEKYINDNFKRWFGDSKVVDENGKPLIVYHGTVGDFSAFDMFADKRTVGGKQRDALFFTSDKVHSGEYAIPQHLHDEMDFVDEFYHGSNIIPVYLRIKNPLVIDADSKNWVNIFPEAIDKALDNNNDGIIVNNIVDNANSLGTENISDTYVVFDPSQIKSAIGNDGNFSNSNNIIEKINNKHEH